MACRVLNVHEPDCFEFLVEFRELSVDLMAHVRDRALQLDIQNAAVSPVAGALNFLLELRVELSVSLDKFIDADFFAGLLFALLVVVVHRAIFVVHTVLWHRARCALLCTQVFKIDLGYPYLLLFDFDDVLLY